MGPQIENNSSSQSACIPAQCAPEGRTTEWIEPPALSLDERGMIQDCSKSFERLFGFKRCDLVWQHVSRLLPQLTGVTLVEAGRLNPVLNYLCHCGHRYLARNQRGDSFPCHLNFVRIEFGGKRSLRLIFNPAGLDA